MPRVMGIVNVTPDSFSDGGQFDTTEAAVAHALALLDEGAAVVDVGGESTRPGATSVDASTERDRVVPVIEGVVAARPDTIVSIDTTKAEVAEAALVAGATIVNDVSASLESVAAAHGAGWIAMHAGGPSATMQNDPIYDDVVEEVHAFLVDAVARGQAAGVEQIWIDPVWGSARPSSTTSISSRTSIGSRRSPRYCWVSAANAASEICMRRATPRSTAVFSNPSRPTTAWRVHSPWRRGVVFWGWTWSEFTMCGLPSTPWG